MTPAVGVWVGASHVLGRPVRVDDPYPHICRHVVTGARTGARVALTRRDCAACAEADALPLAPVVDLATRRRVA